jgi:hypothetical protein
MRAFMALVFAFSMLLPCAAATGAEFGPISITVPHGFVGPIGIRQGSATAAAWI